MNYHAIVIGGGIAGLTAAAYLAKAGHATLLCEKEESCGGLLKTFERDGFIYVAACARWRIPVCYSPCSSNWNWTSSL